MPFSEKSRVFSIFQGQCTLCYNGETDKVQEVLK